MRTNHPDDRETIRQMPYHVLDAGYAQEAVGKQFLARHRSAGEMGVNELFVRDAEGENLLLSFCEEAVIAENKIVYMSDVDSTEVSVYDMEDQAGNQTASTVFFCCAGVRKRHIKSTRTGKSFIRCKNVL